MKEWLVHARTLGAPALRVFAGITPEGHSDEEAFDWAVASLKECVPVAAENGVVMALENHGGIPTTSAEVIGLVGTVNSEWFKVNLDTGNYGLDPTVDPYEGMRRVVHLGVTAHHKVSMNTRRGHRPVDIERVISVLDDANYRGYLNIEFEENEDPKINVPKIVDDMRRALSRI